MRVRTESKLRDLSSTLITRLERIRIGLGVDLPLWSEILGMSVVAYQNAVRGKGEVPLLSLEALTHHLGINLELLASGDIDYPALYARVNGDEGALPERYSRDAFSKRRTSINLLGYLQAHFGWRMTNQILRSLQVNEAAFVDPDALISIAFVTDLCAAARKFGASDEVLREMGRFSAVTNRASRLAEMMAPARNLSELYAIMIEEASPLYDRNYDYSIGRMKAQGCVITAVASDEIQSVQGARPYGSSDVCLTKEGVFSSAARYIDRQNLVVREQRCVHRGDSRCEFHVEFPLRTVDHAAF